MSTNIAVSNKKIFWLTFTATALVLIGLTSFALSANAMGKPDPSDNGMNKGRFACVDNDGGQTPNLRGTVAVHDKKTDITTVTNDTCIDANTVQEYFCAKANAKVAASVALTCAAGTFCSNGACQPIAGSLTQIKDPNSPTGIIADNNTNVTFAKFLWTANDEDIRISTLSVSGTYEFNYYLNNLRSLNNVRLKVNGAQIGATIPELIADGGSNTGWGPFGNSFIIKADTTAVVEIVADTTHPSIVPNDTITMALVAGNNNAQGTTSLVNISTIEQTGNALSVDIRRITVTKNNSFGDKSASNPTGVINARDVKVASLVITAGTGEDFDVTQVVLKDAVANVCIGMFMQNLTIKDSAGNQLAPTFAAPSGSCATSNSYTFNLNPAVLMRNGEQQYRVDVYADLTTALTTPTALITVDAVTANGRDTGIDASYVSDVLLQKQYIAPIGALTIRADINGPVANNYLMGAVDQNIAHFLLQASPAEAVLISQLVVSVDLSHSATGTIKNIRLVNDYGQQIGNSVPNLSSAVAGTWSPKQTFSHLTFSNLNWFIPAGTTEGVRIIVDFTPYHETGLYFTGHQLTPVVLTDYNGNALGGNPVTAIGNDSGSAITANVIENKPDGAWASTATLYRAKLTIAYASDTPSGAVAPSAAQMIMKFVVTNQANYGGYSADINYFDVDLVSNILQNPGVDTNRTLTVYKDSLSTTALGSTTFSAATMQTTGFGPTQFTDANIIDVQIASGGSKTFYVTLDTTDAASTENLSVRLLANSLHWTDGVTYNPPITAMDNLLPLPPKTFTY